MIIKRVVDGKLFTFNLSGDEMRRAYYEQQEKFDREDVVNALADYCEFHDYTEEQLAPYVDEIAALYRDRFAEASGWWEIMADAIFDVVRDHKDELVEQEG